MSDWEGFPAFIVGLKAFLSALVSGKLGGTLANPKPAWSTYDRISLERVDWVPPSLPHVGANTRMISVRDNDAVIKMVVKARAPTLKHVARTHRIDLDWLFERLNADPSVFGRYIHTKLQIADMLTKGNFTSEQWQLLCSLLRLGLPPKCKPLLTPRS